MTSAGADDVHATQAPSVSLATARQILSGRFGIDGDCSELPSERDRNVHVQTEHGAFVLKISNSAENPAVIDMEDAAMEHIAATDPALPIPRLVADESGAVTVWVSGDDGRDHLARVVTVLPGMPVEGDAVEPALATQIGAMTARTSQALAGFFHPAGGRTHAWDIRRVNELSPKLPYVGDPELRALLRATLDRIAPTLARVATLPGQIEHADVTLTNVLVDDARQVTGVIDFGDMHHTASVCDLASSLNSVIRSVADRGWGSIREVASAYFEGYLRQRDLSHAEGQAIADLILARITVSLVVSAWRAGEHPDNVEYIGQYDDASCRLLRELSAQEGLTGAFARMAGTSRAVAPTADPDLRARRDAVVAGTFMPLMYAQPIQLSRGLGPWLIDTDGRKFLDGYNNVPVVGHANRVVGQAISHQLRLLNTNSRYLHQHGVELGERLLATMPSSLGLDTCILVNSGSEAVDLAWRMATAYTGGSGAMIGDTAYHGITAATEPFSSNEWPLDYHPDHVATFEAPYAVGGRTPGAGDASERVDRAVNWLAARGHRPALLLADPMFTSAGILDADPLFMEALGATAAERGALVLADEVQSGFGRTGPDLWAFVDSGLSPDLVTLGKPMGNGHPVAAVITRREVVEAMAQRYEFFSTFAGSPVSAVAALATLDVLEDRDLPRKALATGAHLRSALAQLRDSVPWMGPVRGRGLLAGIEVRTPRTGHRVSASAVAERLRQEGVLVGVTGRSRDVLKVRPPLVWEPHHADLFVAALSRVAADLADAHS